MGRINNKGKYPLDKNITGDDMLLGSDADNKGATRNYSIRDISDYILTQGGGGGTPPSMEQNNWFRYVHRTITIGNRGRINTVTRRESAIAAEIGTLTRTESITVGDKELIVYVITVIEYRGNKYPKKILRKYLFPDRLGKGTYTDDEINPENLELIYESEIRSTLTEEDLEGGIRNEILEVGDIPLKAKVHDIINNVPNPNYPDGYPMIDPEVNYYIRYTQDGEIKIDYFDFLGSGNGNGTYGVNGRFQLNEGELIRSYDSGATEESEDNYVKTVEQTLTQDEIVQAFQNLGYKIVVVEGEVYRYYKNAGNSGTMVEVGDYASNMIIQSDFHPTVQYVGGDVSSKMSWRGVNPYKVDWTKKEW